MGGNTKMQKKMPSSSSAAASSLGTSDSPSFSVLGFFKPIKRSPSSNQRAETLWEDPVSLTKVRPSDYDRGCYVAEPGIDRKASAFIAKFHASRTVAAA
ncbi:hypothetical protein MLD38_020698 [Melastoma candidum]|uniref:Uncharacterized protein n=1 Tax=Melastoma candidum TaxID=119954 RepID=A0ACB9QDP4_9MYRT|nr:hypothetical protein MLD38_020698 [Melastoma candidum]